eukprot:12421281-Karenia_brevis.AAC.2
MEVGGPQTFRLHELMALNYRSCNLGKRKGGGLDRTPTHIHHKNEHGHALKRVRGADGQAIVVDVGWKDMTLGNLEVLSDAQHRLKHARHH